MKSEGKSYERFSALVQMYFGRYSADEFKTVNENIAFS